MWWVSVVCAGGLGLQAAAPVAVSAATSTPVVESSIPLPGPWRLVAVQAGVRNFEAPLPVRPRALFFSSAPEGMVLQRNGAKLRYGATTEDGARPATWMYAANSVTVRVAADAPRPSDTDYTLTWPQAVEREEALHLTDATDARALTRSAQVDDTSRAGLYLPAPSSVSWEVDAPEGGVFSARVGVLPAEVADGSRSDGADFVVAIDGETVASFRVDSFTPIRVPIGRSGRIRLTLGTNDRDLARDHVFVAEPQIFLPSADPRRILLVFVDTLRRDHVGLYGATRGASPHIDALGAAAVVFDDARSVAPWTLPSSRTVLSGLQPERWRDAPSLPERFAARGWATGAFVGNVYLSSNFGMADGWGEHAVVNWPSAEFQVNRGLDFLRRHTDQDALLLVHFMDMHLPYKEPWSYQTLYVDGDLPGLGHSFIRSAVQRYATGRQKQVTEYLRGRYDQNLRYIDDQLARLLDAVGPEATVILFADHGEEFFDHGGLEHGHTLYDELLRVPFLVRAPGLAPRRVAEPISLLDLAPTLLELEGIEAPGLDGRSLVGLARGVPDPSFLTRALGFGRPLYGHRAWGVIEGGLKYTARAGEEHVYDLRGDPAETVDLRADTDLSSLRTALAAGVGSPVRVGFRLTASGPVRAPGVVVTVPGGIAEAWVGDDPTEKSRATVERVGADAVRIVFEGLGVVQREVFLVPTRPPEEVVSEVSLKGARTPPVQMSARPMGAEGPPLGKLTLQGRVVTLTWAVTPLPGAVHTSGYDPEMEATLRALGYVDE